MPSVAAQLIANGLIAGAVYSLVACGFSLIYGVSRIVHFAHGSVLAFGAFMLYASGQLGLGLPMSIIIALTSSMVLGFLINNLIYHPLRKKKAANSVLLIASIAVMTFLDAFILAVWGADVKTIDISNPVFDLLGARITQIQLIIIGSSFMLVLFLFFLTKRTRLGIAMRAVSDNRDIAKTVGINPDYIDSTVFLIGSVLAGLAGVLIGIEQNIYPTMGMSLMIKGFTGAVIGGLSSIPGAIAGSFILGLTENIAIWWLPSGYKDAIAFALLFVFLLFRPQGLLSKKMRDA